MASLQADPAGSYCHGCISSGFNWFLPWLHIQRIQLVPAVAEHPADPAGGFQILAYFA
jgi:hypothetical protein